MEWDKKERDGVFWHKTDSGTEVYVVDDIKDEEETEKATEQRWNAEKEKGKQKGTPRRVKLSDAIKQHQQQEEGWDTGNVSLGNLARLVLNRRVDFLLNLPA